MNLKEIYTDIEVGTCTGTPHSHLNYITVNAMKCPQDTLALVITYILTDVNSYLTSPLFYPFLTGS